MPKAPKRCPKPDCQQYSPCKTHPSGWASSTSSLPSDWKRRKAAVTRRDGPKCRLCGSQHNLELDHVIERADGGSDDLGNLRLLCVSCHLKKTRQAAKLRRKRQK